MENHSPPVKDKGRSQRKRESSSLPTCCLTPGGPASWMHSPFGPWEKRFVSCTGLGCIVLIRGASTGGLLVAVCQTVRSGPATEQGTVIIAACPLARLRLEREHTPSTTTTTTAHVLTLPNPPQQEEAQSKSPQIRLAPGRLFSAKSPGRTTEDLGPKSSILCMREDRSWKSGAGDTKCIEFINSAALAKWEGGWKERWLQR